MKNENEILIKLYKGQNELNKQMKVILKEIPEMKEQLKVIPEMKKQLKVIPEMKEQLKEIPEMKKQLEEISKMKEELRRISGSVARIEVEHGEKLAMLFDAFKMHSEKLESHEKRINSCERKVENQNDQLYYLKSKVQEN